MGHHKKKESRSSSSSSSSSYSSSSSGSSSSSDSSSGKSHQNKSKASRIHLKEKQTEKKLKKLENQLNAIQKGSANKKKDNDSSSVQVVSRSRKSHFDIRTHKVPKIPRQSEIIAPVNSHRNSQTGKNLQLSQQHIESFDHKNRKSKFSDKKNINHSINEVSHDGSVRGSIVQTNNQSFVSSPLNKAKGIQIPTPSSFKLNQVAPAPLIPLLPEQRSFLKLEMQNLQLQKNQSQQSSALNQVASKLKTQQTQGEIVLNFQSKQLKNGDTLEEQSEKSLKELYLEKILERWNKVVDYIQRNHLFSGTVQQLVNEQGLKVIHHFQFVAACINLYLVCTIAAIYCIVQLFVVNGTNKFQSIGIQIFYVHYLSSSNGMTIYFSLIILMFIISLLLIAYYKMIYFSKSKVSSNMQESKGLNVFTMIFCEINWKIFDIDVIRRFQMSLSQKRQCQIDEEDEVEYQKSELQGKDIQQLIKKSILFLIFIGLLVGACIIGVSLNNGSIISRDITSSPFLNECISSSILVIIVEVFGEIYRFLVNKLREDLRNSQKYLKQEYNIFLIKCIGLCFYAFVRSSINYQHSSFILELLDQDFISHSYDCPQQSTAHGLLSLLLCQIAVSLFVKQWLLVAYSYFVRSKGIIMQFKVISNTAPMIIANMMVFMNSSYNFAIFPICVIIFFFFFLQSALISKYSPIIPEYLPISRSITHEVLIKMYLITLFLNFIHLFFISTIDQHAFYFPNDPSRICGPFNSNTTSQLDIYFNYISDNHFLNLVTQVLFWRPLLVSIIFILFIKTLSEKVQYQKWLQVAKHQNSELRAVKHHYKKKIVKLQTKLNSVSDGIKAIQGNGNNVLSKSTNQVLDNTKTTISNKTTLQFLDQVPSLNMLTTEGNDMTHLITKKDLKF